MRVGVRVRVRVGLGLEEERAAVQLGVGELAEGLLGLAHLEELHQSERVGGGQQHLRDLAVAAEERAQLLLGHLVRVRVGFRARARPRLRVRIRVRARPRVRLRVKGRVRVGRHLGRDVLDEDERARAAERR